MKKLVTLLISAMLVLAMAAPAMADNYTDPNWQSGAQEATDEEGTVAGPVFDLDKYLTFPKTFTTGKVPDNQVTYTLTVPDPADTNVPTVFSEGDDTHPIIYVGVLADPADDQKFVKVMNDAKYDSTSKKVTGTMDLSSSARKDGADDGEGNDDAKSVVDNTKDFVTEKIALDFSAITFTEPGIYRYFLEEKSSNPVVVDDIDLIGDDDQRFRTIDVYVTHDTTDNALKVTQVVYQGKLEDASDPYNELPKKDTGYQWSELIMTGNLSGYNLAENEWKYIDPETEDEYKYTYDESEGGWVETITFKTAQRYHGIDVQPGDIKVNTNKQDHLEDALGRAPAAVAVTDYADAMTKGATDEAVKSIDWEVTVDGRTDIYHWDGSTWQVTSTQAPVKEEPADAALANTEGNLISYTTNGTPKQAMLNYGAAKNDEEIVPSVLQGYTWKVENAPNNGDLTTYKYENGAWNKYIDYASSTAATLPGAAKPTETFTLEFVKYSYARKQEEDEQRKQNYNQAAEEAKTPNNGVEAGVKSDRYINDYDAYNLSVEKKVTGNQGSRDKYFQFKIELEGLGAYTMITMDAANALNLIPSGKANEVPNSATSYNYQDIVNGGKKEGALHGNALELTYADSGLSAEAAKDYIWASSNKAYQYKWNSTGGTNGTGAWDLYQYGQTTPSQNTSTLPTSAIIDVANEGNIFFADADGKATLYVYLNDQDNITLKGIKKGATYTLTEMDSNTDGYTTTAGVEGDTKTEDRGSAEGTDIAEETDADGKVSMSDTYLQSDAKVDFTNSRSGVIPTGVKIGIIGGIVLVAIGALYMMIRRKTRYEYEYEYEEE